MPGMLLRNYYNTMLMLTMGVYVKQTQFADGYYSLKNLDGSLCNLNNNVTIFPLAMGLGKFSNTDLQYGSTNSASLIFGSGTTPVTFDDYKLASIITSDMQKSAFSSGTPSYDPATKKWSNTNSIVLTNTGSSTITINEVGIILNAPTGGTEMLVYREVFTESLVLAAGSSVTYKQKLEYTMPTVA